MYGLAVTAPAIKEFVSSVRYNEAMKRINEFLNRSAWDLKRVYPYLLIALSSAALLAAMVLMVEEVHLLKNPTAQLGCDLNPIISCGSVMKSSSSHVFGIPNPVFGIPAFAALITIGVMMLLTGRPKQRWFWIALELGTVAGMLFVLNLMYHSIFVIGALCPWCMTTWAVMIPLFFYTTLYNIGEGHIALKGSLARAAAWVRREHALVLFITYAAVIWLILYKFWYYWSTLF